MNPMDIKRGIDKAVSHVTKHIISMAEPVNSKEAIQKVASIASNNDKVLGALIADAFDRVGNEGVVSVQDGKSFEDSLEVVEGMKFDRGYISPFFITESKKQLVEYENPYILFSEKKLSSATALTPLLEQCHKAHRPLIIIAEDVDGEALSTLLLNRLRMNLLVCAIKAPGFGDNRKNNMRDMAILTGGQVMSEDLGHKLEEFQMADLGTCAKITISKDDTIILDGGGQKSDISERVENIRAQVLDTDSTYEKEKLEERLGKLVGGVAVIRVGGSSEIEVNEKKDRMNDALNATKAAIQEGIVPGGGLALLYSISVLDGLKVENADQMVGVNIIKHAMKIPATAIIDNAGKAGAVYVGKMLETATPDSRYGYDAATDEWYDFHDAGVVDPAKVVRHALQDAASVAGLMTTTEVVISDLPKKDGGQPRMDMGGPGGGF